MSKQRWTGRMERGTVIFSNISIILTRPLFSNFVYCQLSFLKHHILYIEFIYSARKVFLNEMSLSILNNQCKMFVFFSYRLWDKAWGGWTNCECTCWCSHRSVCKAEYIQLKQTRKNIKINNIQETNKQINKC